MPISWQSLPHHLAPLILCPAALMFFTPIFRTSYLEEVKGLVVLHDYAFFLHTVSGPRPLHLLVSLL